MLLGFVCVEFCGANVHCDKAQFACGEVFKAFLCTTWELFFWSCSRFPLDSWSISICLAEAVDKIAEALFATRENWLW